LKNVPNFNAKQRSVHIFQFVSEIDFCLEEFA